MTNTSYINRLQEVNARLSYTDVRGKEYAEVPQRVQGFYELFPDGHIVTEIRDDGMRCDCKASVYRSGDDVRPAATGHAYEEKGAGPINKTSYVENCETSAVGRALGFLGIGSASSIASAEEVANAISAQESKPKKKDRRVNLKDEWLKAKSECVAKGVSEEGINAWYIAAFGKTPFDNLSAQQQADAISYIHEMRESASDGHLIEGQEWKND